MLLSLLILGALSILATTAIVVSMGDRNFARYDHDSLQALAAAETGVAFAKRAIVDRTANMLDEDNDGRPDFRLSSDLPGGASFEVAAEASDIKGLGITAYQANGFRILSEGEFNGARRRVKMEIVHDSFLKFARFVSQADLSYSCGAVITGEVYTGQDLSVPCGCAGDTDCKFLESVYVVGDIPNVDCAEFFRGYVTGADTIDLSNSFDWSEVRNKVRGLGADNSCEGRGSVGIYISLPGTDPLGLHSQSSPDTDVLLLHQFDFVNTTLVPGDTVVTYRGAAVPNPVTGTTLRARDFNGLIYFNGTGNLRGAADGVSGRSLTVYCTSTCIVRSDIISGHTGFDPVTRLPNGSGDPVSVGLVAETYIGLHANTPRVLRIDAALLSRTSNWRGLGIRSDHPVAGPGPLDLDLDGIFGETPHNDDPVPGEGWDEQTITEDTWVLNINGPIITQTGGDANPWNDSYVLSHASGPTRRYNYDMDITTSPPPCYPVPLNLWKDVSWTEIFETRQPLASYLE